MYEKSTKKNAHTNNSGKFRNHTCTNNRKGETTWSIMHNYPSNPISTHFQGKENVQDDANIWALSRYKIQ